MPRAAGVGVPIRLMLASALRWGAVSAAMSAARTFGATMRLTGCTLAYCVYAMKCSFSQMSLSPG